jgi:hypothetical protein
MDPTLVARCSHSRGASLAFDLARPAAHAPGRRSGLAQALFFLDKHEETLQWAEGFAPDNTDAHAAFRIRAASGALA